MAKYICSDCEKKLSESDIDDDGMSICCWSPPVRPSRSQEIELEIDNSELDSDDY